MLSLQTDRFSTNTREPVFNCRGCGRGGDVISLVQHLDGCNFPDAVKTLSGDRPAVRSAQCMDLSEARAQQEPKKGSRVVAKYDYLLEDRTPYLQPGE